VDGYIYRVGSYTNVLGRPPRFVRSAELLRVGARFASVYALRKEDAHAVEHTAGTAAGFRGTVWSRRLWIDFDTMEAAVRGEEVIKGMGLDYVVYDTGSGRGLHIGVLRAAAPSHTLPMQDKLWATANMPGCDLGLYWHLHLIRLPGALHERTGLPKRLLRRAEGQELTLPPYVPTEEVHVKEGSPQQTSTRQTSVFRIWEVMSLLTGESGTSRHKHLVQLAKALKEDGKVTIEEAMWVVWEVNRGFGDPKPREEVVRIVKWAYGLEG
jgi:hypothetical protein